MAGSGGNERKRKQRKRGEKGGGREIFTLIFFFLIIVLGCQPLLKIALFLIYAKYPFPVLLEDYALILWQEL